MAAGATYETINTITIPSNQTSIVLSSIPSTYTDLKLVITGTHANSATQNFGLRFNGDTSQSYSRTRYLGDGTNPSGERSSNSTFLGIGDVNTNQFVAICDIMNYSNSTGSKSVLSRSNQALYVSLYTGTWRNSSPINSITVIHDSGAAFVTGTTMTLWGIKCA